MDVNRAIRKKFHIHRGDHLPFRAWRGSRNTLAEFLGEIGYNYGAEVGVREGVFSEILCKANPNLKLLSIDYWGPYRKGTTQEIANKRHVIAIKKLKPYNATIIHKTSMEALNDVEDNSLDFVYIDAMHSFDDVMMDIICWSRKVRHGGIVSGHDYAHAYQQGVVNAVDAYTYAHYITLWYITRDKDPSFLWVKK